MMTKIKARTVLDAISPAALSAYARVEGWAKTDAFGDHSDVYIGDGLPEIILPRTKRLGDYPDIVARLIKFLHASQSWGNLSCIMTW